MTESNDIGLKLLTSSGLPFLSSGIILACLKALENKTFSRHRLYKYVRDSPIHEVDNFKIWG